MTSVNIRRSPITYMPECFALFFSTRCTPKNCYLDYDFINQQAQIYHPKIKVDYYLYLLKNNYNNPPALNHIGSTLSTLRLSFFSHRSRVLLPQRQIELLTHN